jgi:magnesium transporter
VSAGNAAMAPISHPAPPAAVEALAVIPGTRWYHLNDPHSPVLDQAAEHFGIHPLQVEDCRHRRQLARLEEHEGYNFVVIKVLVEKPLGARGHAARAEAEPGADAGANSDSETLYPSRPRTAFEDFDIFIGPDYVLTVDEGNSALVETVRPRVAAEAVLRTPQRIAHALLDAAVDRYLPALDRLGEIINRLEDRVIRRPAPETLREIFRLKRELLEFRRAATAMREAVNGLLRQSDARALAGSKADRELRVYYRDVYDHLVRVLDFVESYRDLLTGALDVYLSAVANRTNEVMKILTLWGTIALPLLVLTSLYGMNVPLPFQEDPRALAGLALVMVMTTALVVLYFRRKRWF